MSYSDDIEQDLISLRTSTDLKIDELMRLSALQERARIFERLRTLIQEKDSNNDTIAAEVLSWAWEKLSS
jgi:hypothetical protein